jgi:hypothetical protein
VMFTMAGALLLSHFSFHNELSQPKKACSGS